MDVTQVPEKGATSPGPDKMKAEDAKDQAQLTPNVTFDVEEVQTPIVYSKRSIGFMVLFSGLAIGSDAYNSASMGQLLLLLTLIYPESLNVATQAQLTNSFIIGLVRSNRPASLNFWCHRSSIANGRVDSWYAHLRLH